jgi:hypothetical protein
MTPGKAFEKVKKWSTLDKKKFHKIRARRRDFTKVDSSLREID